MENLERRDSTDSIDKELDWLIQKDEEEALNAEKEVRNGGHLEVTIHDCTCFILIISDLTMTWFHMTICHTFITNNRI